MAAASPTLETVLTAIKTALDGVGTLGTVVTYDHKFDVDWEYLESLQHRTTGVLDVWIVDLLGQPERELTPGEVMVDFLVRVRYYNIRKNSATWGQTARTQLTAGVDVLSKNANVFAIGNQRQLDAPETVDVVSFGKVPVADFNGTQTVFLGELRLVVEARRWT